jgi:hypothetical protein
MHAHRAHGKRLPILLSQPTQRSHSRIVSADESSSALFGEPFAPASDLVRGVFYSLLPQER